MKAKKILSKFVSLHLWVNLAAMAAVLALLIIGLMWWLGVYTHHGEGIEVPDLYGMDYHKAAALAEEQGLRIEANDSTHIEEMPGGCVVVQSPVGGKKVKEGRIIYVTINSLTKPLVKVPDVVDNSSYREAKAKLEGMGFEILPPKLIDGEKDWVYGIQWQGRNVHTGDKIAQGEKLTLIIGKGEYGEDGGEDDEFSGHLPEDGGYGEDNTPAEGEDDIDEFLPINESMEE